MYTICFSYQPLLYRIIQASSGVSVTSPFSFQTPSFSKAIATAILSSVGFVQNIINYTTLQDLTRDLLKDREITKPGLIDSLELNMKRPLSLML